MNCTCGHTYEEHTKGSMFNKCEIEDCDCICFDEDGEGEE